MSTTIDQLQIEVETKSEGAIKGIQKLKSTLASLKKSSENSGLDATCEKLTKIASIDFSNLAPLAKIAEATKPMEELGDKIKNVTSSLADVPNEIGTVVDTSGLSESADKIANITSSFEKVPKALDIPVATPGVESATTKLSLADRVLARIRTTTGLVNTGFRKLGTGLKFLGTNFLASMKQGYKSVSQILNIVLIYGGAFRAFMLFTQGVSEGLQNISQYSSETSTAMSKLSTMSLYLKNSIGAALYPVIIAITPALESMANAIVRALNAFNQFVASWGGATTFLKAKKYLKEYGDTAKKTANQIKKSFAGMDEISVIGNKDTGSSADTPDYSQMFEASPVSATVSSVVENLKANMTNLKAFLGGMALCIGSILVFSGANVPLGLGLMIVGAYALGSAVSENWGAMDSTLKDKFSSIMLIIGASAMVIGAILTFSGAATGLGIALMIGGAATMATAVAENWEGLPNNIKNTITIIGLSVGAASLVLGTILAFTGAAIPLGIGLMIVGAAELATAAVLGWDALPNDIKQTLTIIGLAVSAALLVLGAVLTFTGAAIPLGIALLVLGAAGIVATAKLGWNTMSDKVKNTISIITAIVSTALLVLGIILVCTGVGIPLGIALIVIGAAGLAATVAVNWDFVKKTINTILSSLLAIISGFGLVLGILLCLTGAGLPLGIALIMLSLKGVTKAADMDDNPVTRFVKGMANGIINIFESAVNFIIKMLNKLHWDIPDWVPLIGGGSFGFDITPINIPRLKDGGFPDGEDGLFYANHNEMVGKFSNGRTAVANNDQIVEGIQSGVYAANREQNELLREQNKLLRKIVEKDSNGEINVKSITTAMNRKNRRDGKTIVPVGT